MIIHIAPIICIEHIIPAGAAGIHGIGFKARTGESELIAVDPQRPVALIVEYVFGNMAGRAFGINPFDIVDIVEIA